MYDSPKAYIGQSAGQLVCEAPRRQTLRERLLEQKLAAEAHLQNLTDALNFMDKNPDFENFHNIIGKAGF
jgi:hypothetical protein